MVTLTDQRAATVGVQPAAVRHGDGGEYPRVTEDPTGGQGAAQKGARPSGKHAGCKYRALDGEFLYVACRH